MAENCIGLDDLENVLSLNSSGNRGIGVLQVRNLISGTLRDLLKPQCTQLLGAGATTVLTLPVVPQGTLEKQ